MREHQVCPAIKILSTALIIATIVHLAAAMASLTLTQVRPLYPCPTGEAAHSSPGPHSLCASSCPQALRAPAAFTSQQQRPRSSRRLQRCYAADEEKKLDFSGNKRAVSAGGVMLSCPSSVDQDSRPISPEKLAQLASCGCSAVRQRCVYLRPQFLPASTFPCLAVFQLGHANQHQHLSMHRKPAKCSWPLHRQKPAP